MYKPFSLLGVFFVLIQSASAQPAAERVLPERGYLPGASIGVILTVPAIDSDTTLMEIPPAGWPVGIISSRYVDETGQITIPLRASAKPRTFQYCVTAPPNATGDYSFCGHIGGNATTGMTTISPMKIEPVGIFADHRDFGDWTMEGDASFDAQTGEYVIRGTGTSSGNLPDFGHAAYSEISGDFRLKAKVLLDGPNAEAYIGFVDNLQEKESTWYTVWVDNSGGAAFWRTPRGASWSDSSNIPSDLQDGRMEVVREGNVFTAYYYNRNTGERIKMDSRTVELTDPIHVCLASWSGSLTVYSVALFSEVELTVSDEQQSAADNWDLYK